MGQASATLEATIDEFAGEVKALVEARGGQCERITGILAQLEPQLTERSAETATIGRIVADELEPWLAERLLLVVPPPDVRSDAGRMPIGLLDAATLYARCRPWLALQNRRSALAPALEAGMQKFSDAGRAAVLMFDMPDLQPIALGLLRVEVLGTLLEHAGCTQEQQILDRCSGALARDVLRRVVLLVDAYLKDPPSPAPRIDFAGVATRFDDLVVIVSRVFEASRVTERNAFARSVGTELLNEFGGQLQRLTISLLRAATTLHKPEYSESSYRAVLMQLARLHGLFLLIDERQLGADAASAAGEIANWCSAVIERDLAAPVQAKSAHLLELARACGVSDSEAAVALLRATAALPPAS